MAYDTFVGVALDATIQGSTWDSGGLTWLTPTKLLGDGANSVKMDATLTGPTPAGNFVPDVTTDTVAVFFVMGAGRPTNGRVISLSMQADGSTGSQYTSGGAAVRVGSFDKLQVVNMADQTKATEIAIPVLSTTQQYCAELIKTGTRSYTAKLYSATNNVRDTLLYTTPTLTLAADYATTAKLCQVFKEASPNVTIQRVEANGQAVNTPVSFTGPVPTRNGAVGSAASFANAGFFAGSATPFTYSSVGTALPAGLTLSSSTGIISGTPTTAGTTSGIIIRATDANNATADTNSYSIVIAASNAAPTFPGTIANITGTGGAAITPVNVSGQFSDTDALTFSASPAGTAWPSGLTISSAGVISGTVATSTTTGLKVRATDTASQTVDSNAFNVTIAAPAPTTGSFKTAPLANNTGTLWATGTSVKWQWNQRAGGVGTASTSVTTGTATVAADGTVTMPGVPLGAGDGWVAGPNGSVYYQPGTVA